jgi:hypothetical protein
MSLCLFCLHFHLCLCLDISFSHSRFHSRTHAHPPKDPSRVTTDAVFLLMLSFRDIQVRCSAVLVRATTCLRSMVI